MNIRQEIEKRPLLAVSIAFLAGEILRMKVLLLYFAAAGVIWIARRTKKRQVPYKKTIRNNRVVFLLLLFCVAAGGVWSSAYRMDQEHKEEMLREWCQNRIRITSIGEAIQVKNTEYGEKIELNTKKGRVLVYLSQEDTLYGQIVAGEQILAEGYLENVSEAANPGQFDAEKYYGEKEIHYVLRAVLIRKTGRISNGLRYGIMKVKMRLEDALYRYYESKYAGILADMLLGERSGVEKETRILYQKNGISHILAISGMHVALLGNGIVVFLILLGWNKRYAALLSSVFLILYGILTGLAASTVRAIIMLMVTNAAIFRKRVKDTPTTIGFSALLVGLLRPGELLSTGVILSYSAVIAVAVSRELYKRIYGKERFLNLTVKQRKWMKLGLESILSAATLNLIMLPILLYSYYEVSPYQIALNLIVVPLLTVAVVSGAATAVAGSLVSMLSLDAKVVEQGLALIAFPAKMILQFYEVLCRAFGKLPCSVLNPGHISPLMLAGMECVIFVILIWFGRRMKRVGRNQEKRAENTEEGRRCSREQGKQLRITGQYVVLCFFMMACIMMTAWVCNEGTARIIFLSVGQGDAAIIHEPFGGNYIVDAGSSDQKKIGSRILEPALKYYGMSKIDGIFISHSDWDHISGLVEMLQDAELYGMDVNHIYLIQDMEMESALQSLVLDEAWKTKVVRVNKGGCVIDKKTWRKAGFQVLAPGTSVKRQDTNEASMVLYYTYGNTGVLFTGDIGESGESGMVHDYGTLFDNKTVGALILKCPHHGSKTSTGEELLNWYQPDFAVISCGLHNSYGHPSPETLDRLQKRHAAIYRTDLQGAIEIRMTERGLKEIVEWKEGKREE